MSNSTVFLSKYKIRPAQPEDLPHITAIERESFPKAGFSVGVLADFLERSLVSERGISVIKAFKKAASGQDEIVGWSMGEKLEDGLAELSSVAVLKAHRQQGIGMELLKRVCTTIKKRHGLHAIQLHVDKDNASAIRLYERYGFLYSRTERHYYEPGRHAQIMTYRFNAS